MKARILVENTAADQLFTSLGWLRNICGSGGMVDTQDLKSCGARLRTSSSLVSRTIKSFLIFIKKYYIIFIENEKEIKALTAIFLG